MDTWNKINEVVQENKKSEEKIAVLKRLSEKIRTSELTIKELLISINELREKLKEYEIKEIEQNK